MINFVMIRQPRTTGTHSSCPEYFLSIGFDAIYRFPVNENCTGCVNWKLKNQPLLKLMLPIVLTPLKIQFVRIKIKDNCLLLCSTYRLGQFFTWRIHLIISMYWMLWVSLCCHHRRTVPVSHILRMVCHPFPRACIYIAHEKRTEKERQAKNDKR